MADKMQSFGKTKEGGVLDEDQSISICVQGGCNQAYEDWQGNAENGTMCLSNQTLMWPRSWQPGT